MIDCSVHGTAASSRLGTVKMFDRLKLEDSAICFCGRFPDELRFVRTQEYRSYAIIIGIKVALYQQLSTDIQIDTRKSALTVPR